MNNLPFGISHLAFEYKTPIEHCRKSNHFLAGFIMRFLYLLIAGQIINYSYSLMHENHQNWLQLAELADFFK